MEPVQHIMIIEDDRDDQDLLLDVMHQLGANQLTRPEKTLPLGIALKKVVSFWVR